MAEDDLIFEIEGVGSTSRNSVDDSDDEEQYLICSITDYDEHKSNKICNHNYLKGKLCETSSSPVRSFNFKNHETSPKFGSLTDRGREAWKHAFEKAKHMPDPWAEFHLEEIETETATRYRYNAISGKWVEDEVLMKMAKQPFGRGAMRECYRTKKLSNFTRYQQWKSASNYVAKCYIDSVDRDVYFEDVRLQMEAKLWGEEYSRHKPPKQVDIMQMCILEMKNRPGKPLYHLEHYIEGKYIKYNSNSGFVRDENFRLTPQAFSHFTFERSAHQLIVVDIQGVGDLYTDPQIHTSSGTDFGDGNLGVRGMALFFHSHACNSICKTMGLTPFDLSQKEMAALEHAQNLLKTAKTVLRGSEEVCGSNRVRTLSGSRPPILHRLSENSGDENVNDSLFDSLPCSPSSYLSPKEDMLGKSPMGWTVFNEVDNLNSEHNGSLGERRMSESGGDSGCPSERRSELDGELADRVNSNARRYCESDEDSIRRDHHNEDKWNHYHSSRAHSHWPSCVAVEVQRLNTFKQEKKIGKSILGKVHLAMVRYHEAGRFCEKLEDWDRKSAIFHLEHAALCGELEAIVALSLIYLQLPHHILTDVTVEDSDEHRKVGFDYLLIGAEAGDRPSMIRAARAFDTGISLGPDRVRDWKEALYWYNAALNMTEYDEGGEYDGTGDEPKYSLLAREAEIHMTGGFGVEPDPQTAGDLFTEAAEAAMASLKGRLANQYYQQAEEAWARMEE
ncbi:eukaryotic elongation factor 2 kinase isoform X1 [Hypanus sabinus]|uniref:eukaryotic elongation factor 2 kinase isoform X1 n=1 Tax=Hypanus sabinus TaxID=79690 RepID=UPI0028C39570|nr:eukaryotic elongation factor 2 kinase isoform X1 [Hypanus sabinus]XP_059834940.1 eukaryotic elongation factor 2 kinase isoform X1 [Hypanus sabinus]XP_059834941.1 eukaryotic elongation factor 2 kinase isoform X1 [Hypanus sabinus]XP_059834942.1 eukaryotic elongation factor 2 kinase isoform X1 [Hypanus sabinus]